VPLRTDNSFWAEGYGQGEHDYLNVRRFAHENVPMDVYIYVFAPGGRLESLIHAERAEVRADGTWLLIGVSRTRFSGVGSETDRLASLPWHSFLPPQQVQFLILPAESMPPVELYRYVRHLEQQHQPAARYAQELWTKINLPFVMAGMIMIAIPFVFGPLRTHGTGHRIMVGAMIGIVFTLVQQITSYAGLLLGLNAALTATMPSLMLAAAALYLSPRVHA
jgi:lipopolysaccharide export system permease protein